MKNFKQKLVYFITILSFFLQPLPIWAQTSLLNPYTQTINCPVLVYHNLTLNNEAVGPWTTTAQKFEEDIKLLQQNNYTPISTQQLQQAFLGQAPLPDKPIIIQFDDGYHSVYELAYPILKKYKVKAEIYIITDFTQEVPLEHNGNKFLSWPLLKEMENSGLVHTYLHGKSHDSVKQFPTEQLYQDYLTAQYTIKKRLGDRPLYYVYPNGEFTTDTLQTINTAGCNIQFIWYWNITPEIKKYNILLRTNIEYDSNVIDAIAKYNTCVQKITSQKR